MHAQISNVLLALPVKFLLGIVESRIDAHELVVRLLYVC